MLHPDPSHFEVPFIRQRFPDWPEEKLREAEMIYLGFLELQIRIFEESEIEKSDEQVNELTESNTFGIN